MRALIAEFFQSSDLMGWSLLATALFLAVFVAAMVRLARRPAADFDPIAHLPLEDDRHE